MKFQIPIARFVWMAQFRTECLVQYFIQVRNMAEKVTKNKMKFQIPIARVG